MTERYETSVGYADERAPAMLANQEIAARLQQTAAEFDANYQQLMESGLSVTPLVRGVTADGHGVEVAQVSPSDQSDGQSSSLRIHTYRLAELPDEEVDATAPQPVQRIEASHGGGMTNITVEDPRSQIATLPHGTDIDAESATQTRTATDTITLDGTTGFAFFNDAPILTFDTAREGDKSFSIFENVRAASSTLQRMHVRQSPREGGSNLAQSLDANGLTAQDITGLNAAAVAAGEPAGGGRRFNSRVSRYLQTSQNRENLSVDKAHVMALAENEAREGVATGQVQPQSLEGTWQAKRERRGRILARAGSIGNLALNVAMEVLGSGGGQTTGIPESVLDFSSWSKPKTLSPAEQTGAIAATQAGLQYDQQLAGQLAPTPVFSQESGRSKRH